MGSPDSELPFARQERLRFVESVLLWEGSVQRQRVCDVFGVSANHVTKDLRLYEEAHPGNIQFQARLRSYVPMARFKPAFASEDPAEYLSLVQAQAETGSTALAALIGAAPLSSAAVPTAAHAVDRKVLRSVVQALRERRAVDVLYLSMSSDKEKRRTLWPHALFLADSRWYARAFDSAREQFRDFALQRILQPVADDRPSPTAHTQDDGWHEIETLEVVPNPRLTEHQKKIVTREYGMHLEGGSPVWKATMRRCLVPYFARQHDLDLVHQDPKQHRIVLRNRNAMKRLFIAAERD